MSEEHEKEDKEDKELLVEVPPVEIGEVITEVEPDKGDLLTEVPEDGGELIDEDPARQEGTQLEEGEFLTEGAKVDPATLLTDVVIETIDLGDKSLNETPAPTVKPPRPKRKRTRKKVVVETPLVETLPIIKTMILKTKDDFTAVERKALKGNFSKRTLLARYGISL